MSGKGKERFQRGKFASRPNYGGSARKENRPSKQSFSDWNYFIGSSRQASEFDAITEQLMNLSMVIILPQQYTIKSQLTQTSGGLHSKKVETQIQMKRKLKMSNTGWNSKRENLLSRTT